VAITNVRDDIIVHHEPGSEQWRFSFICQFNDDNPFYFLDVLDGIRRELALMLNIKRLSDVADLVRPYGGEAMLVAIDVTIRYWLQDETTTTAALKAIVFRHFRPYMLKLPS